MVQVKLFFWGSMTNTRKGCLALVLQGDDVIMEDSSRLLRAACEFSITEIPRLWTPHQVISAHRNHVGPHVK